MQLASNGSRGEDDSETEPILSESHLVEESHETTLCEIRTVDCDTSAVTDVEADENCSLVNPEQPQCRICLEIEVLSIILVGLLYGFFIAIICGQRISERHYHVLAKQELTKEYIVEDRESKDVPELDPSHISELRMLGLY
uniref:Uncharacterized protein n=1 Tax=Chenopodium quinoa TaxID=63459 RepID=A0A803KQN8_CHEQI